MNTFEQDHSIVAVYESHVAAEAAVRALQTAGLDVARLSILGTNLQSEEHAVGFYTVGDSMKFWGTRGAFWGGLGGLLLGGAFFFIPPIGPLVAMGPLVGALAGAVEGATVGAISGVLGAALIRVGIPMDRVMKYELDVKAGRFLVIANAPAAMVDEARRVLAASIPIEMTAEPRTTAPSAAKAAMASL